MWILRLVPPYCYLLDCAEIYLSHDVFYVCHIMSFFFLMFLFYVGDNVEFKYGVGYSYCMFHICFA